jgi:hypothetical protein
MNPESTDIGQRILRIIAYLSLFLLFLTIGFSACNQPVEENKEPRVISDKLVDIVIYDSCEYIVYGSGNNRWGSHKGNCKNPIHKKTHSN